MPDYFYVYNEEPSVACTFSWLSQQEKLGCSCGKVLYPRLVCPIVTDVSPFTSVATRLRKPSRVDIGGKIGMLRADIADAIGIENLKSVFHVGEVTPSPNVEVRYFSIVEINALTSLFPRSEKVLFFKKCDKCQAPIYGHNGPIFLVNETIDGPIYPSRLSADAFFVRDDIARKIAELDVPEIELEPVVQTNESPDGLPLKLEEFQKEIGTIE